MDPKEQLVELEKRVVAETLEQLEFVVKKLETKPPSKKVLDELEVAVKLCHQVRSLLGSK